MPHPIHFGLLLFPDITALDLVGPAEVLKALPGAVVHLVWKTREPVATGGGWSMVPTTTYADCPQFDVLCVPGGSGQIALMDDEETLSFLRRQADGTRWITSVCTGSLVLAAAGLLDGYRAACHWMSRDQLALLGAIPAEGRVVRDRNRLTGGGVTAGIDFGLALVAELAGEEVAKGVQLALEYAPAPPFDAGTPETAGPELTARVTAAAAARQARRLEASRRAQAQLPRHSCE